MPLTKKPEPLQGRRRSPVQQSKRQTGTFKENKCDVKKDKKHFEPRDYQIRVLESFLKLKERGILLLHNLGFGKTCTTIMIIDELFPQMKVKGTVIFKVTRNADSDREDEDTEDLLAMIEEELRQRRFAEIVRIEFANCTDVWLKNFLMRELELSQDGRNKMMLVHRANVDYRYLDVVHEQTTLNMIATLDAKGLYEQ